MLACDLQMPLYGLLHASIPGIFGIAGIFPGILPKNASPSYAYNEKHNSYQGTSLKLHDKIWNDSDKP